MAPPVSARAIRAGAAFVEAHLDDSPFTRQLRVLGNVTRKFARQLEVGALFAGGIGAAITAPFKFFIDSASRVEELTNRFRQTFRDLSDETEAWAQRFAFATQRSIVEMKELLSTFQPILLGFGFTPQVSTQLSKFLTQATVDLSSFFDISQDVARQKLLSGLAGEIEPLRRLGIPINEATVRLKLLEFGLSGNVKAASEAQKAIARIAIIAETMSERVQGAFGDLFRTLQTPANLFRSFTSAVLDLRAAIGKAVLPLVQTYVPIINEAVRAATRYVQTTPNLIRAVFKTGIAFLLAAKLMLGTAIALRIISFTATTLIGPITLLGSLFSLLLAPIRFLAIEVLRMTARFIGMAAIISTQVLLALGSLAVTVGGALLKGFVALSITLAVFSLQAIQVGFTAVELSIAIGQILVRAVQGLAAALVTTWNILNFTGNTMSELFGIILITINGIALLSTLTIAFAQSFTLLTSVLTSAGFSLTFITGLFVQLPFLLTGLTPIIGTVAGAFLVLGGGMQFLTRPIQALSNLLPTLASRFRDTFRQIGGVIVSVGKSFAVFDAVISGFNLGQKIVESVGNLSRDIVVGLRVIFTDFIVGIVRFSASTLTVLARHLAVVANDIASAVSAAFSFVFQSIKLSFRAGLALARDVFVIFRQNLLRIVPTVSGVTNQVLVIFRNVFAHIARLLFHLAPIFQTGWQALVDALSAKDVRLAFEIALVTVRLLWTRLVQDLILLWNSLRQRFAPVFIDLFSQGQNAFNLFALRLRVGFAGLVFQLESIWNRLFTNIGNRIDQIIIDLQKALIEVTPEFILPARERAQKIQQLEGGAEVRAKARRVDEDLSRERSFEEFLRRRAEALQRFQRSGAETEQRRQALLFNEQRGIFGRQGVAARRVQELEAERFRQQALLDRLRELAREGRNREARRLLEAQKEFQPVQIPNARELLEGLGGAGKIAGRTFGTFSGSDISKFGPGLLISNRRLMQDLVKEAKEHTKLLKQKGPPPQRLEVAR